MKKAIYIHIGRPKVGSSAIQHFLFVNKEKLLSNYKTLYPNTGMMQMASHKLALVFLPDFLDAKIVKDLSPESIFSCFVDEIEQTGAFKTIISSENFYFIDPNKLPLNLMRQFNFKIICYLRRQDEVLVSSYVQEIKDNAIPFGTSFESYTSSQLRMDLLDYYPVLNRWAGVFGKENIEIRVYEKEQMKSDIFRDIINAIDLPWDESFIVPDKRINPSPAMDILEYICMVNNFDASNYVKRSLKRPLLDISENLENTRALSSKNVFSLAQRKSVLDRYRESNQRIAKEYLKRENGKLFYDTPTDKDYETCKYPGISVYRLSKITAGLFLSIAKANHKLTQRLSISEKKIKILENELNKIKHGNYVEKADKEITTKSWIPWFRKN